MVGVLMVLLAAMVLGIVYTLLRFSAEEEARASEELEAWRERSVAEFYARRRRGEDDDAA